MHRLRETLDNTLPVEDAQKVWTAVTEAYNKRFAAKYKQFEKVKKELLDLYGEMLEAQNEAFGIRDRLTAYAGKRVMPGLVSEIEGSSRLNLLPIESKYIESSLMKGNIDMIYFAANTYTGDEQCSVFDIVHQMKHKTLKSNSI